jgi:glycosyltransferase involved in cell wall biosynthesis
MKILQVCGGYSMGGLEQQTIKIAKGLINKGHELMIYCSKDSLISSKCKTENINYSEGLFDIGNNVFKNFKNTYKILKKFKPDIIHVQRSHDLFPIVLVLYIYKINTPLVFTRRMESSINKKTFFHKLIYKRINKAYAISSFIKDNLIATTPIKPDKVEVLNNGVDLKIFNPLNYDKKTCRKKYDMPLDATIIGMVGRISPMKGHKEFVRAASELFNNRNDKLFFAIIGGASVGEESFAQEIYKLAKTLLPSSNFRFYEFTDSVAEALATMDIFIFPSYRESFGNALLEAMAMQLPIVTTYAGGVKDIIICGENALCIEPKNHLQLVNAVNQLLNNEELKIKISIKARKTAEKNIILKIILIN